MAADQQASNQHPQDTPAGTGPTAEKARADAVARAADRLFTIGLAMYASVLGLGLLLRSLPEALTGWLATQVYDGPLRTLAFALAALGAGLLALGVALSVGDHKLRRGLAFMRELGPVGLLGVAWTAAPAICGTLLLVYIGDISAYLERQGPLGLVLYTTIFILSAGLGALPTYSQAILGGWAFGPVVGFLAAWVGFIGASLIGYTVARTIATDRVERLIARNRKAQAVRDSLVGHGLWRTTAIVTLLRVPPNSPFALTNLAMSSAGVARAPFLIGTAVGMAPRTLAAVLLAAAGARRGDDIAAVLARDPLVVLAGVAVAMLALGVIGLLAKRALRRVASTPPAPAQADARADTPETPDAPDPNPGKPSTAGA